MSGLIAYPALIWLEVALVGYAVWLGWLVGYRTGIYHSGNKPTIWSGFLLAFG
jgi:hypothetical protein